MVLLRSWRGLLRKLAYLLISLVVIVALFLWWAVGKSLPRASFPEVSHDTRFEDALPKDEIVIGTYNIAYAQGVKAQPTDWRDKAYTEKKVLELEKVVQNLNADILLLQEVDLRANRSHFINQAEVLAKAGQFPYTACALVWDENYVPFPLWPPKFHLGKTRTANCVLSKYPMTNHKAIIFDKPDSNPFWYNWGYLERGAQRLEITIGSKILNVVNLHLEAFEEDAREKQVRALAQWVSDVKGPLVIGGDFNAVPSNAPKKDHFIDEPHTTYFDDHTIDYLKQDLIDFTEAVPQSLCNVKEHLCLTFPADAPTRRLDYLFATRGASFIDGRVVTEAREASDHLPVLGVLSFDN